MSSSSEWSRLDSGDEGDASPIPVFYTGFASSFGDVSNGNDSNIEWKTPAWQTGETRMCAQLRAAKRSQMQVQHRLKSIKRDADWLQSCSASSSTVPAAWPIVGNLRCGVWYVPPGDAAAVTSYFKSSDGHARQFHFAASRLNLQLLPLLEDAGGLVIVDATRRGKQYPDSLSKTLPVWCAVMNRLSGFEGVGVDLPPWLLPIEVDSITAALDSCVEAARSVVPESGVQLRKPIRMAWVHHGSSEPLFAAGAGDEDDHYTVLAASASDVRPPEEYREMFSWHYIQGAADDEEGWARGLTYSMFWQHHEQLSSCAPDECEALIDELVAGGSSSLAGEATSFEIRSWRVEIGGGGENIIFKKSSEDVVVWPVADVKLRKTNHRFGAVLDHALPILLDCSETETAITICIPTTEVEVACFLIIAAMLRQDSPNLVTKTNIRKCIVEVQLAGFSISNLPRKLTNQITRYLNR